MAIAYTSCYHFGFLTLNIMTQEELKTCLGQLLLDLRGNWAYDYYSRLQTALQLCNQIECDTRDIKYKIDIEMEGDYDGRIFRGCSLYGYSSDDGTTDDVKQWLENNLTHPEYCSVLQ